MTRASPFARPRARRRDGLGPQKSPGLDTWRLAAYAAPQLALAALYFPVFIYLTPFYNEERGLSLELLGLVLVVVRLVDAFSDPLMGFISDRVRTRFGRRKLWLALSTPFVCLSVWMAMRPPDEIGLGYVALWFAALALSWTVALTPYQAWGAELATDYAGRARVTAWREGAQLIGALSAAILYALGGAGGDGLALIALVVVISLPFLSAAAVVFAPEPVDRSRVRSVGGGFLSGWRLIRENQQFLRVVSAQFINSAANALPAILFLFYAPDILQVSQETAGLLLALFFVTAVMSTPLWPYLARIMPKHRAWCYSMMATCAVFAFAPFLGPDDLAIFIVICALTGIGFGADSVLPPAIQADVVDVDTAESRMQRTGLFFAIWSVATKIGAAMIGGLALWLLGAVGYSKEETNSETALQMLVFLYAVAPIALKLIAVWLMWGFTLDRSAQEALQRRIETGA